MLPWAQRLAQPKPSSTGMSRIRWVRALVPTLEETAWAGQWEQALVLVALLPVVVEVRGNSLPRMVGEKAPMRMASGQATWPWVALEATEETATPDARAPVEVDRFSAR